MDNELLLYKNIVDTLNAGIWQWNIQTNQVRLDQSWAAISGYTLAELEPISTQTFIDLCHSDDLLLSKQSIEDCIAGKIDYYSSEIRLWHKQGHWVWVLVKGKIVEWDNTGKPLVILGVSQDISDTKGIKEALRVEEQRFKVLTKVSKTGAWQWDAERKHLWCSEEYFAMLGRPKPPAEVEKNHNLGNVWGELLHPDDKERAEQSFASYLAQANPGLYESEFRMAHSDGSWVWILSRGSTLRDKNGQPTQYTTGTHINITQLKLVQQQFMELNATLEQRVQERTEQLSAALSDLKRTQEELLQNEKLASLGGLVAGVSHELNTPIGNALTVATTLANNNRSFQTAVANGITKSTFDDFVADNAEGCEIIERNLNRAAQLISSFKQLAVDQTSYQRRKFDLKNLVTEVLLAISPTLRKTKHRILLEIPPGIEMDSFPGPLSQVLVNLVNNAIHHAFTEDRPGEISLSACYLDKYRLRLTIADNGIGIEAKAQKNIFDPFYTTKLGQGGSGLGLHISYSLVTGLLGGSIKVKSKYGYGSSFILSLPISAPAHTN